MQQAHLFNWDLKNPNSINYGKYYWGIFLNDGRYIYVNADKAVVTDSGDLMMMTMRKYKLTKVEQETLDYHMEAGLKGKLSRESHLRNIEKIQAKESDYVLDPYLVIAKGNWISYFAASFDNGNPVILDNSEKLKKEKV
jgi:hypothetical protein